MKTPNNQRATTHGSAVFKLQASLVMVAAIAAGVIVTTAKPTPPADSSSPPANQPTTPAQPAFDMLAYMDEKVGVRESDKDVRCWSSFTELQIFITQCKISPGAKGARTRLHAEIIESIWRAAREEQGGGEFIGEAALGKVLQARFPSRETPEGVQFDFGGGERPRVQLLVLEKDKRDYEQTIEPWRLLQNWATAHIDKKGQLTLQPPFDKRALELMYRFLRSYDLAILKKAGEAAKADRLSEITAESVGKAFRAVQQKPD